MKQVTTEKMQELMDMLTGFRIPEGVEISNKPNLSQKQAASVIWFLQECTRVLPDYFEVCAICGSVFDTRSEGHVTGEYDDWHEGIDLTPQQVKEHEGECFCSRECEVKFWNGL
jgi:hypothetical protein